MSAAAELGARAEAVAESLLAAAALLDRIESMTTVQFSRGDDRKERERLRAALERLGMVDRIEITPAGRAALARGR